MSAVKCINRKSTPEYMAFVDARRRCEQPSRANYHLYGGRGIKFLFNDFDEFYSVLGKRPDNCTLDRINNNGHYEPNNVRWATRSVQMKNRRKEIINQHKAMVWLIETPDNQIIKVTNMSAFCKKQNLCKENLHITMSKNWKHKGFKVIERIGLARQAQE